jgi:DNA-binding MarR family transcriptional regulator
VLLAHTAEAIFKVRQRELHQYGMTMEKTALLFIVDFSNNQAKPSDLARWIFREPNAVTGLLNRMEKEGLVRRVKDLDKKNFVRVEMTPKGRQYYLKAVKTESVRKVLSSLSKEQSEQLDVTLQTLWKAALAELGTAWQPAFPEL